LARKGVELRHFLQETRCSTPLHEIMQTIFGAIPCPKQTFRTFARLFAKAPVKDNKS